MSCYSTLWVLTVGVLIALALDLQLRAGSEGRKSLDDVMRLLWQAHGQSGIGVAEDGIFAAVREVGGYEEVPGAEDYALWMRLLVRGDRLGNLPEPLVVYRAGAAAWDRRGGLGRCAGSCCCSGICARPGTSAR